MVSVVVPAFRAARFLPRCIESVLAQTYTSWELIIVEQSNDESARIVRDYQVGHQDRIRLFEQPNTGASGGRNRGIQESRGEFVAFLDADDEFLPRKLERQLELFRLRPQLGLAYCDYAFKDALGGYHPSVFDELAPRARAEGSESLGDALYACPVSFFELLLDEYLIATITGMVRRSVLADDVRFSPGCTYAEEWLFFLEVAHRAPAGFVDEPLCLHHHVEGSVTRTSARRNLCALVNTRREMLLRFGGLGRSVRRVLEDGLAAALAASGNRSCRDGYVREGLFDLGRALRMRPSVTLARQILKSAMSSTRQGWRTRFRGRRSTLEAPKGA